MATILIELGIIFLSLVLGVVIASKMKLPQVVGVLAAGAIIGPFGLSLVSQSEMVDLFSEIGAILLLFVIGIEFSINKIISFGIRAVLVAVLKLFAVFIVVYEISLLFNLNAIQSVILGAIFAITSTTIFSKIVKSHELARKEEISVLFAVLIVEDILAVFLLSFFSSLSPSGFSLALPDIVFSISKSLLVLVIAYLIVQRVFTKLFDYIMNFHTSEMFVFSALALCALFAFFAGFVGLTPSIGAFLAGSMISTLRDFRKIEKTILPFGLFFSSFFFLSIGMLVNASSIVSNFFLISVLVLISMIVKFSSISLSSYIMGQRGKSAIFSGITMISVGEFSLLISKQALPFFASSGIDLVGLVSASVFITSILSAVLINQEKLLSAIFSQHINNENRNEAKRLSRYMRSFVIQVEPHGSLFNAYVSGLKSIIIMLILLILVNSTLFLSGELLSDVGIANPNSIWFVGTRILLHLAVSIVIVLQVVKILDDIIDKTLDIIGAKSRKNLELDKRAIYDGVFLLLFGSLSIFLPFVFSIMKLPHFFNHLALLPALLGLGFLWDMLKTMHEIIKIRIRGKQYDHL